VLARVFRGYAPDAVDELVRSVAAASERTRDEIRELNEEARRLGAELEELEEPERELRETFVVAQREAAELRAEAARKADAIRAEARGRTQERAAWLEAESTRIRSELERMRGAENELHESMRLVLLDALRRLDEPAENAAGAEPEVPASRNGTLPAVAIASAPAVVPAEETIEMPVPARIDEPPEPPSAERAAEGRPLASRSLLYAIAILVAAAGIGVAIWQLRAGPPEPVGTTTSPVEATTEAATEPAAAGAGTPATTAEPVETAEPVATTAVEPPATTAEELAPVAPTRFALVLRASGGDCWLSVRAGSASGRLLFEGFLFNGESRRFEARRVWMRVGSGGNLAARLNGKPLRGLPAGTGDVLVTADGARTLALG
jgi:DivIVA protein/Domain of unknown function (DUF4115)